jgi:hypothetical protein
VRDARGVRERVVPFAVSLGWTLLMPIDRPLYGDYRWLGALWLFGLALPMGYWSRWAARPPSAGGARRHGARYWLAVPPLAIFVGLTLVPAMAHFRPAHWSEWLASLAGTLAGWRLAEAAGRRAAA